MLLCHGLLHSQYLVLEFACDLVLFNHSHDSGMGSDDPIDLVEARMINDLRFYHVFLETREF